ncbi:hypothetical protein ACFLXY_00555 [Chloroflexota bacterium]
MMYKYMKYSLLYAILILTLSVGLLPGCGNDRSDYKEVINKAIEATNQTQSYRVDMLSSSIEQGETRQTNSVMEFVAPDRLYVITRMLGEIDSSEEQIQIGTTMYTRENNTDNWHVRDWGDERMAARDLAGGTLLSLEKLVNIEALKDEKIDGIDCYHYTGSMNMEDQQEEELASLDESDPFYEQMKQVYESIEYIRDDMEVWIGKDDHLLRQYAVYIETTMVRDKGEDTEEIETYGSTTTLRFYDYNEPIEITTPSTEPIEGVRLSASMRDMNIGSDDPEHYAIEYEITVVNMGTETANNLRLFLETKLTDQGQQTFEAPADSMPVDLGSVDEAIYHVSWEVNLVELTKEKFMEFRRQNTLRATWIDADGVEREEVLIQGQE